MTETFERRPKTGGEYRPLGRGELLDHDDRSLRVKTGATTVEVTALAPDLFRVGMFPEGRPPRYDSEAIAKENWEPVGVGISDTDGALLLSTNAFTARVRLDPLRTSFTDSSGTEFAANDAELG